MDFSLIIILILAIFVGFYVIRSVTPALHSPLMSITNAISSVIVVGGIIAVMDSALYSLSFFMGLVAVFLASINIFGGFFVTNRMLEMFKKKSK